MTGQHFLPIESFAAAVFLDDHVRNLVDAFVARESPLASETLPAPPDRIAFLAFPRVDHLVMEMAAEWTFHILLLNCCRPQVLERKPVGDHVHACNGDRRYVARDPCQQGCGNGLLGGNHEERRHAEGIAGLKSTANAGYLRDGTDCGADHHQSCGGKGKIEIHSDQHQPELQGYGDPKRDRVDQNKSETRAAVQERQTLGERLQGSTHPLEWDVLNNPVDVGSEDKQKYDCGNRCGDHNPRRTFHQRERPVRGSRQVHGNECPSE